MHFVSKPGFWASNLFCLFARSSHKTEVDPISNIDWYSGKCDICYIHTHMYTYTHIIYIYMYANMYIYIYTYIYELYDSEWAHCDGTMVYSTV